MDRERDVLFLYVGGADKDKKSLVEHFACEEDSCDGNVLSLGCYLANTASDNECIFIREDISLFLH